MSIFWENVDLAKQLEVDEISLFGGSFCLPPYLGFRDKGIIYVIAFLSRKSIEGLYKNIRRNFPILVNNIFNRRKG